MQKYMQLAGVIASIVVTSICWIIAGDTSLNLISTIVYATIALSTFFLINPALVFLDFRSESKTLVKLGPMVIVTLLFFFLSLGTYILHLFSISAKVQTVAILINYGLPITFWLLITGVVTAVMQEPITKNTDVVHRSQLLATLEAHKASSTESAHVNGLIEKLKYSPDDNGEVSHSINAEIFAKIEAELSPSLLANNTDKISLAAEQVSKLIDRRNSQINLSRSKS